MNLIFSTCYLFQQVRWPSTGLILVLALALSILTVLNVLAGRVTLLTVHEAPLLPASMVTLRMLA